MRFIVPISALTAVSGTTSSQDVSKAEYDAACDTISKQIAGKAVSYCKVNPISSTAVCHQLLHVDGQEGLAGFHYHTSADAGTEEKPVSCQYAVQFLNTYYNRANRFFNRLRESLYAHYFNFIKYLELTGFEAKRDKFSPNFPYISKL